MIRFFNPAKGYSKIRDEVLSEIDRVLTAGDLILRDDVEKFERSLAEYVGTKYAVALNSGTDALYLSLKALGIGKGHRVAVPSYTFVATAQVVNQVGADIALYDIDGNDKSCVDIDALMVAHLEGKLTPCYYESRGVPIIEDACQALGALKNPTSDIQCWSFYPAKTLGSYGDAGAITTNNKKIYEYIKEARNHFKNTNDNWGINSRMDNIQAAILNVKFKYLPQVLKIRQNIADMYYEGLRGIMGLELPEKQAGRVYQDYVIRTEKRDLLYNFLKEEGIECLKNEYPFPIPKLPQAVKYESETLRIPCNENLEDEEALYIISKIKEFFA